MTGEEGRDFGHSHCWKQIDATAQENLREKLASVNAALMHYLSECCDKYTPSADIERCQQRRQCQQNDESDNDDDEIVPDTGAEDTQLLP